MSALVFTNERIGPKRSLTPDGFLLCEDVPIARIGTQLYGPEETDVTPLHGVVKLERTARDLFDAKTIASFNGKPVTNDHPPEMLSPQNAKQYIVGVTLNPRRGKGSESDLLIADLLITDADAIADIGIDDSKPGGKREISCGYDASHVETAPGHGEQRNIIGNHVALVSEGRCGPRCAIGDSSGHQSSEIQQMATKKTGSHWQRFLDRLSKAVKDGTEDPADVMKDAPDDEPTESGKGDIHIHNYPNGAGAADPKGDKGDKGDEPVKDEMEPRMAALEKGHAEIKGMLSEMLAKLTKEKAEPDKEITDDDGMEGDMDEDAGDPKSVKDSVPLQASFKHACALAEVIVPGIRLPSFDAKAAPKKTFDSICKLRKDTLELANNQAKTRALIEDVLGGRKLTLDRMNCDSIRHVFNAVGGTAKTFTNHQQFVQHENHGSTQKTGRIQSLDDLQRIADEMYGRKR